MRLSPEGLNLKIIVNHNVYIESVAKLLAAENDQISNMRWEFEIFE